MFRRCLLFPSMVLILSAFAATQETHNHGVPEKLGKVDFSVSCDAAVQAEFNRAVALLHSFAYSPAENAFRDINSKDPRCAMAHWESR